MMKPFLIVALFGLLLLTFSPASAQTATPVPTIEPPDNHDIFSGLNDANTKLNQANTDITAPNGSPILPATTGREIFKYAKWLLSTTAAEDVFGPFAPIVIHLGIWIAAMIALTVVYVVIYLVSYAVRWIIFLVKLIIAIVQAIASVISAATGAIGSLIGGVGGALGQLVTKVLGR